MLDAQKVKDGTEVNWYTSDFTMQHYFKRYLPQLKAWGEERLIRLGDYAAGPMNQRANYTDRDGAPKLIRYDREGNEINEIWYNEGYLTTVADCLEMGVVGLRYREDVPEKIPFFYTQLMHMLMSEAETGFTCPVTLTMAVAFVLEKFGSEDQKRVYLSRLASMDRKTVLQGATFLTEIQGGSDVGAIETKAVRQGSHYLLTGEKWFASNCDAGVAIALARTGDQPGTKGLSLFLLPHRLESGEKNRITIRRLKDKLGVRAVASGELVLDQTVGFLIGEENHGFKYMAEALNVSRMCTATGALGISRRSFLEALIYAANRRAFGHPLTEYPMVRQTLLDMIVDIELNWALIAQMMLMFDRVHTDGEETEERLNLLRLLLAISKARASEDAVKHAKASLELHGGNGYIEEYITPRLLRDAQVNTVWEGTTNIMALEVVKILAREAKQKQGAESALLLDLRSTLSAITLASLQEERELLLKKCDDASGHLQLVVNANALEQNAYARQLLDELTDLYCCVHLLEEAQYAKQVHGSDRMANLAKYAVLRTYRPDAFGIGAKNFPAIDLFDQAVCYAE